MRETAPMPAIPLPDGRTLRLQAAPVAAPCTVCGGVTGYEAAEHGPAGPTGARPCCPDCLPAEARRLQGRGRQAAPPPDPLSRLRGLLARLREHAGGEDPASPAGLLHAAARAAERGDHAEAARAARRALAALGRPAAATPHDGGLAALLGYGAETAAAAARWARDLAPAAPSGGLSAGLTGWAAQLEALAERLGAARAAATPGGTADGEGRP